MDWFNDDGYPTDEALWVIENWPWRCSFIDLLEFVHSLWKYDYWREWKRGGKRHYQVSTAGWSGNEELERALHANTMFWAIAWVSSERGGHFRFVLNVGLDKKKEE